MDDSAIQYVPNPLHMVRSRSCSDFFAFDSAFDDVMRKAVGKSAYVKRFKPLIRRLALLSFVRILLICTPFGVEFMRADSFYKRENQEPVHQEQSNQTPFLLEHLPIAVVGCVAFSLADFGSAVFLWYSARKMRGQWFLSAANMGDGLSVTVGWFESDDLILTLGLYLTSAILATVSIMISVGIIELYSPGLFISLWWHVGYALWNYNTVDIPDRVEVLLVILPCVGLAVFGLITAWQCRRTILQFREICWADGHDNDDADLWIVIERVCYRLLDLVDWLVMMVGYIIFVLLRRKEVFCVND
ncbi:uncharacterized protein LOC129599854 [Paramacrobiotus metropolitanus]|uniref:uncharacterized protein LOC129599854 n=1 Tax=Paramacrobiotus metropolitanus TaxID=2943436 RepID=UPI002445866E|nr:uncharacterized protein LOC129599854 [Paramacrobiotus metropolitanus]